MKTKLRTCLFALVSLILLTALLVTPAPVRAAAALTVNTLADNETDDGLCTLREAIIAANTNANYYGCAATGYGDDTITFSLSGTIVLGSALPAITAKATSGTLMIDGAGQAIVISGNHAVSIFTVTNGAALTLQNLTVADANSAFGGGGAWSNGTLTVANCTFSDNHANQGGGISAVGGTLTVSNSTFSGNSANTNGGGISNFGTLTVTNSTFSGNSSANNNNGGGIYNDGTLTVTNSTFTGNSASNAGGGINNSGTLIVTNSTFSGNSATNSGGGIFSYGALTLTNSTFSGNSASNVGGGIMNGGTLTVANSTFSTNSASSAGGGLYNGGGPVNITNSTFSANSAGATFGGGLYNGGSATLRNTIIANSTSGGNCDGTLTDGGGNLTWGDTTCPGLNADPILSALGNYGGPTQTFALLSGSAAINTGNDTICAAAVGAPNYGAGGLDQRGTSRPQGTHCDMGAFEYINASGLELLSPANGITLLNNRPTFDWVDFTGAIGYNIQISKNIGFTQLVSNTNLTGLTNSSYTPAINLAANTPMWWRVRAKLTTTTYSAWSDIRSFTTANPPPAPTLTAPATNTLVTAATVLLNWNDVTMPGGTFFQKYEVQMATDAAFTVNVTLADAPISEYTTPALTPNTKYYWRVRAYNSLGQYGIWSASRYFRAALSAPNSLTPGTVTPPGPANDIYTRRPTFTWGAVPGATNYTVEVSTASTFATKAINATAAANSYTHTMDLAASTTFFWRVKTNGANGPSAYSQVRTFITGNPPSVPTLSAPANNALVTTTTPLLDWNNSTLPAGTTFRSYNLEIALDSAFNFIVNNANVGSLVTDSNYVTLPLANGTTYYWRVRAVNTGVDGIGYTVDDQFSGWSLVRSFRVPFAGPVLTLPADLALGVPLKPTFTWTAVAGATNYTLQVSKFNTFSPLAINKTVTALTYTHILNLTPNTVYYWRVRANGPYGPGLWSATFSFTTTP